MATASLTRPWTCSTTSQPLERELMNFRDRLRKLEEAAKQLRLAGKRCTACGGAMPSMLGTLLLGPEGVALNGMPCAACAQGGGGGLLRLELGTGRPERPPQAGSLGHELRVLA